MLRPVREILETRILLAKRVHEQHNKEHKKRVLMNKLDFIWQNNKKINYKIRIIKM